MYRSDHDAALTRARIAFRELRDAAEEKGAPMLEAPPAATDSASELTRLAERCEALRTVLESKPSLAIPTMGMVGPSLELRKRSRRVVMLIGFLPLALVVVLRGTWGAAAVVAALLKAAALLVALHVGGNESRWPYRGWRRPTASAASRAPAYRLDRADRLRRRMAIAWSKGRGEAHAGAGQWRDLAARRRGDGPLVRRDARGVGSPRSRPYR